MLISLLDAHLAFGDRPLLDGAQLALRAGERLGLIGRNGTGKSTLLRVIAGAIQLDAGNVQRRDGLRLVSVEQEPELPPEATLRDSLLARAGVSSGAGGTSGRISGGISGATSAVMSMGTHGDEREHWRMTARLAEFMQRFDIDPERPPSTASGGERKRAALALALALDPELLLLDEPTNHLDIEGIERLETLLQKVPASIVITHDRAFLDRITTRIIELDRGLLRSYPGNFAAYEARKVTELAAEDVARRRFDKFWQQEEVWIRKGIEARRTRNEGRVKRLERLRLERTARRERLGQVKLSLDAGERSGQLVAELTDVSKSFGDRPVIRGFSARVMRGDRIGLIGQNGAGKSTLLRVMLGEMAPDSGTVKLGTNLRVAYFDQLRTQLDPERSVADTISPGSDWIELGGERRHISGYMADFLFPAQRAQSPVKMLSGGERNRLLLARLFATPANLVVLDEPTNDLDIDSLELLEQKLQDYPGTLLLVSHDRRFLDNVVTQTMVAEGNGFWREYVGGYSDWLQQRPAAPRPPPTQTRAPVPAGQPAGQPSRSPATGSYPRPRGRMSYKDQRELAALPDEIEALEREQAELVALMSGPDYHLRGAEQIRADRRRSEEIETLLLERFARWEQLEQARGGG